MSKKYQGREPVAVFITKLLEILEDEETNQIVQWIQTYDGFKIHNIIQFTQQILPKYFKHTNFSSFVKQLNIYGFTKVKSPDNSTIFQNPDFQRGNKNSLRRIQRKNNNYVQNNEQGQTVSKSQRDLAKIKQRQIQLEERFKEMMQNNRKLFNQNMTIFANVKKEDKKTDKVLGKLFKMFKINPNEGSTDKHKSDNEYWSDESSLRSSFPFTNQSGDKTKNEGSTLDSSFFNQLEEFIDLNQFEEMSQVQQNN